MIPRGADSHAAFLRWMFEDGKFRAPSLYGKPGEAPRPAEVPPTPPPAPPPPPKAPPPPGPVDRKSLAAGDDWDAAEVFEDPQEEDKNQ